MLDFSRVVGFDWDQGNGPKKSKHGVEPGEVEQVFFDERLIVGLDALHGARETRFHGLGQTVAGRLLQVTFTMRGGGTLIRVISARAMSRKERVRYGQEV
jgi:uncharacterized DUF497 family protein